MAPLLELTRNTNKHPILEKREREATYGKPQRPNLRASLPPEQRNGTNKHAAVRPKNAEPTTRPGPAYRSTTDNFEVDVEEPITPIQTRKRRSVVAQTVQPQRTASKYRRIEDDVPARQEQQAQKHKRGVASWICIGLGALVIVYSIVYLIIAAWIATSNAFVYGAQNHTSYTQVAVKSGTKATTTSNLTLITSNLNGTIYVTVIQAGHATTYTGPTLKADAWNGDLNGVVATAKINDQGVIVVDLMGTMNILHPLYVRPTMQFSLVPDKQAGYKVVMQP